MVFSSVMPLGQEMRLAYPTASKSTQSSISGQFNSVPEGQIKQSLRLEVMF